MLDLESELIQLGMTKIRDHANNGRSSALTVCVYKGL